MKNSPTICNKCNSRDYCANRSIGMVGCINYNKYPRERKEDADRKG